MKKSQGLSSLLLLSACHTASMDVAQDPIQEKWKDNGIHIDFMDTTIMPQQDFYRYANGKWLTNTPIPSDKPSYGSFSELSDRVQHSLKEILTHLDPHAPTGSPAQHIRDLNQSYLDEKTRETVGVTPLKRDFQEIAALQTKSQFFRLMGKGMKRGWTGFLQFYVDVHKKDPAHHALYIAQDGLGLPDREYYLSKEEKFQLIQSKYRMFIEQAFALSDTPISSSEVEKIYSLEKELAKIQWSRVENRHAEETFHLYRLSQLEKMTPKIPWRLLYAKIGLSAKQISVLMQPSYSQKLGILIQKTPLSTLQLYEKWKRIQDNAPYLTKALLELHFQFYHHTLEGIPEMEAPWKRALSLINQTIGEDLGKLYVEKFFAPKSKRQVESIVKNLLATLREDLDSLSWMSPETRKKAKEKLAQFHYKIGYPQVWKEYVDLDIVPNDLIGNLERIQQWEQKDSLSKLHQPVNPNEWFMNPQTVNAYYSPSRNEIVFPAAVLQAPFFDPQREPAINYGSIGAVIGHEITHGFDDQGRRYDGKGRLTDWWSKEDEIRYKSKADQLVAQFSTYHPLADVSINGELTLGENIADLGGLKLALRTYRAVFPAPTEAGKKESTQLFFLGFAQMWKEKSQEAFLRQRLATDVHAPPMYRVLGPCSNLPDFYEAFDVQPGQGMYRAPQDRVEIW
jgi:putative endopeptidase